MQIKNTIYIILYFLYWIFFSWLDRILFILLSTPKGNSISFFKIIEIYKAGLKLDLSMAAYICAIPFLVFCIWSAIPKLKIPPIGIRGYSYLILTLLAILTSVNINLYPEWNDKISKRAIDSFLEEPKAILGSANFQMIAITTTVLIGILILGISLYKVLFKNKIHKMSYSLLGHFILFIIGGFSLFTCIRGGYGKSTLNESVAYFSEIPFQNHSAVNTYWAFINDYVHSSQINSNPYIFSTNDSLNKKILNPIFQQNPDSAYSILNSEKPNIVFIILESFTADLVGVLDGEKNITPHLDSLSKTGILFTNFYASSDRSDKGIISLFSGFPAQGKESIIKFINKHEKLPAFTQQLNESGYHTSFYYGGQSEFYNFKSFMKSHGIANVVDVHDFSAIEESSAWGVYDELVFQKMLENLDKEKEPFLSSLFTITHHEPFDLKGEYHFGKQTIVEKFKSTAYYTDSVLYDFIQKSKEKKWFQNTLFIITADHGHRLPYDRSFADIKRFQIPLIIFGNALKDSYKGTIDSRIISQVDLSKTILNQLQLPSKSYPFSRNIFNKDFPQYAFFNTANVLGMVTKDNQVILDLKNNSLLYMNPKNVSNPHLTDTPKVYLQETYTQFLRK